MAKPDEHTDAREIQIRDLHRVDRGIMAEGEERKGTGHNSVEGNMYKPDA